MADTSLFENKIGLLIWKTSILWQSKLRKILYKYKISLNEYLILQSLIYSIRNNLDIHQSQIATKIGVDVSVASVTFMSLEKKKYISRKIENDNRKKIIEVLKKGEDLFNLIYPLIEKEEMLMFNKLNNETFNFTNSLKLLLGKKIRIKAEKQKNNDR